MPRIRLLAVPALALLLPACTTVGPMHTPPAVEAAPGATDQPSPVPAPHQHAAPPQAPTLPSPVVVPLDAASRSGLPRETVTATAHDKTRQCEGVALAALLQAAGAMPGEPLRGAQLGRYVQVDARDGYRALFALAELDPTLGARRAYLVDRCDGKPLGRDDGPLRLLVPDEARPARWVRQVQAITVIVAP